jgi:serine/threonine protein kinase
VVDVHKEGGDGIAPAAPSIGPVRRFGRYTLVKKLATGGMAEIWLARQRGLAGFNRFVVIKKILSHLSEQETFVRMFLDEARTSAQLNHPNVVQIYDLGRESDSYYIAMEFIAGENLAAIAWRGMKRGRPLSPQFAARIIADTCKALHYAHHLRGSDGQALEIVHRDISPQNILVTYEGEVKVVDFGIAKAATKSEHTKTGMLKGKFSYMSPEQCLGTPVDMRSDIFALGILLYELCTGKRLFKHESELMILEMITKRTVVPPSQVAPGISSRLEEVIMTALEKPVERRYQTSQDMQIALEEYLREEQRAATNADIASYMRGLFEDKIEEKRLLREAASRDDFESAFTEDEEETEQAMNARGQGGGRRRVVHGLPPSQVRVGPAAPGITGASMPQLQRSVTANFPNGALPPGMMPPGQTPNGMMQMGPGQTPMGYLAPYGQAGAPMAPGMGYTAGGISYGGAQMPAQPETSSWIARLVIIGALVVILVASAILYQQLMRNDVQGPPVITPPVTPTAPPKTGKLVLDSSPTGAAIYLDGKPMMLDNGDHARTPSDLTSLQYGTTYNIRLVKEGHDLFEQSILMDATTDTKTIRPKLKPRPGKLIVEVTGPNARDVRIFLGNDDVGLGPTITKELDAFENVIITAKLTGMTCSAEPPRVRISPDATQRSTVRCEVARAGTRTTERTPREGQDSSGTTTRRNTTRVATGGDAAKTTPGGCAPIPSLPPGYVTISTNPFSDIYIGGKRVGETPLARHKLPSGCVEVKAVTKDGKSVTQQLTVEPNKVMIYKFDVK